MAKPTKKVFCAQCQKETQQAVTVTGGDFIFACDCGRFKKLPATLSAAELAERIAGHKKANEGLNLVRTEADQIEVGGMSKAEVDAALAKLEKLG